MNLNFKVDNQEFTLSPMTFGQYSELVDWARSRYIQNATSFLKVDTIDSDLKKELLRETLDKASRLGFDSPEILEQLSTPAGVLRLFHASVAKHHPSIAIGDLNGLRFTESNLAEFGEAIALLNEFGRSNGAASASQKKKRKR